MHRREFLRATGGAILATAACGRLSGLPMTTGTTRVAAVGDCMITRKLSILDHNTFGPVRELLRGVDVCFGNCEMTFPDPEMIPAVTGSCGDLNNSAEGPMAEELHWAGFNLMATANNHALDYGPEGMYATSHKLDQAGIAHAGTGRNLADASAPAYWDYSSGRGALVACASSFRNFSAAASGNGEIPGRPGLSPLRVRTQYRVDEEQLKTLQGIARELFPEGSGELVPPATGDFVFLGNHFVAGSPPDVLSEGVARDMERIVASVRRAKRNAGLVIVSIHAHESDRQRVIPAKFLPKFAHACVDAGCDVFVGHGPHVLRGMELYKGKPIFYSLGNFIFEAESMRQIPQEIYDTCSLSGDDPSEFFDRAMKGFAAPEFWQSVLALPSFSGGELSELKLYPIDLQSDLPRAERGAPVLASGKTAKEIIDRLARLSAPFGTRIEFRNGIGHVDVGHNKQAKNFDVGRTRYRSSLA